MKKWIIGSRESRLAVAQTNKVMDYINHHLPDAAAEILTMKTTGDKLLNQRLDNAGGKGLFVKELDVALLAHRTDLSVHSLKDLPMEIDERLPIIGYLESEDASDALVLPRNCKIPQLDDPALTWQEKKNIILENIDIEKPVGTASRRREQQFLQLFPECLTASVRGNVQTRLRKLDEGEYAALILASAGLKRLGLSNRISYRFSIEQMVPAAGQGIIAVQGRAGEDCRCLLPFFSEESRQRALCERAAVCALAGSCATPIGVHAVSYQLEQSKEAFDGEGRPLQEKGLQLIGYYYNEETKKSAKRAVKIESISDDSMRQAALELSWKLKEGTET